MPEVVSNALLRLRGLAGDDAPIFTNPVGGPLTDRAVNYMLKAAADRAGLPGGFSAHWLRTGMRATLSTTAPHCQSCRRLSGMATSQ